MLILSDEIKKPKKKPKVKEVKVEEELDLSEHLIAYTDGGAKPNPGCTGYGLHGYFYVEGVPKVGHGAKATPTADGYMEGRKDKPVTVIQYIDTWGSVGSNHTNNIGELVGVITALETADTYDVKSLLIYTDSEYVRNGITKWIHGWKKNNWTKRDGAPVLNQEYWKQLDELKTALDVKKIPVEFKWVKGHDGNLGNTMADQLATKGVIMAADGAVTMHTTLSPPRGYWNEKNDYNYLFSKTYWYLNTNVGVDKCKSKDGRYVYYTGRHNEDDVFLGKKTADASYCVLFTKDKEPALEVIRDKLNTEVSAIGNTSNEIVVGELNSTTRPKLYNDIVNNDGKFIYLDKDGSTLKSFDGTQLARIKRPARVAMFAFEYLVNLELLLESYLNRDKTLAVTCITDMLYTTPLDPKKKMVLKKEYGVGIKSFNQKILFDGVEKTIKLLFDMDLPDRNALAKLPLDGDPKIKVVVWEDGTKAYRYACIVEIGTDISIWSSVHSNLILI